MKRQKWARLVSATSTLLLTVGMLLVTSCAPGGEQENEVNVVKMGADNTGATDCTDILTEAHAQGKCVYYPNGTYLFNGRTLDLSGGVRFESQDGVCVRNSVSDVNILNFDDQGNLIGLMQNHLEENEEDYDGENEVSGNIVSPPLSQSGRQTKVDVMAYWYNDFGLECTRSARTGWIGWYYWSWNHHDENNMIATGLTREPYDSSRHPLLGFYLGDQPEVLDWQSYYR